ncbi:putative tetratricopeptide-like helical domain superfamily [Helianthus annuus]|uniref:Putative pentatricopeptide repeat (PPR) superfamily protein n=1 Tax=Helianthus annuus TaxID=4232 RepID=A0A251RMG2_HELAN|nr:pentatricopeptide repeat-containing protein At1g09220, mitochondrial [Helianthus annuus]KAF5754240.1 putative tetratricopeptide-like helical domain superfamily [Helianthus annuus]KAJ0432203.1 putative tetratricopeptide-like helical domain superfamily [Helianthus annuus]KAJ0631421.1 putative tetratricopeptide-like helical domain superfamily [Helianthus annuus]KAJ0635321.1 putative tetratricopeptide-like helical domain superfamily [Helianthus annuus]KAJ0812008.1 putative tetratricopeptide-lik
MRKDHYSLLSSLLHNHHSNRRSIQQIHSHLVTTTATIHPPPPTTLWTTILRHYSLGYSPKEAILLYKHHLHPTTLFHGDSFTYAFVIKSCANSELPISGSQLHSIVFKTGFQSHVYVQTALVNMYVVCGCLRECRKVFDEMPLRNLVTWNVLVTGLAKRGEVTLARSFFDVMPVKNVVSWSGMIDGYTRANQPKEAVSLFRHMVALACNNNKPTEITVLALYPAIWNLGSLELCQCVHAYGEKNGFYTTDIRVTNALIDVYARCGSVHNALRVFELIPSDEKNLVSWTSIITVFAMHGMAKEAVDSFKRMEEVGMKPNRVTFLSVISACSHGGLVEEGLVFFKKMVNESCIVPDIKHYGCLIDMLARAGRLEDAEKMALEVPKDMANDVIWRTLLGACSYYDNVEMGKRITSRIFEMERRYSGDYVLLSNIFSGVGDYVDSENVRRRMDQMDVCKLPGCSSI